jgi:hypothetical protein
MRHEEPRPSGQESEPATAAHFSGEAGPEEARAWEQVDTGRYMPRRIKGSCKGRALG